MPARKVLARHHITTKMLNRCCVTTQNADVVIDILRLISISGSYPTSHQQFCSNTHMNYRDLLR